MLKKTTFAVLGLAFCGAASAGMYSTPPAPTCTPGDVTVPCEATAWDLGIQALYLRPVYSSSVAYVTQNDRLRTIDADWGWGYRVQGSYHYSTGSDLTMSWTHYDVDSNPGTYVGPYTQLTQAGPTPVLANYVMSLKNRYDQVNLVAGQHTDLGMVKNARFYGGLQYARLQIDETRAFAVPAIYAAATNGGAQLLGTSYYNGLGPVIGIDYSYDLPHGLSLTANTAASVLYGSSRVNAAISYNNNLVASSVYGSKHKMVSGLEAKLGANYAYEMSHGVLNLEGGYQVVNYFNVVQSLTATRNATTGDFGLYGPYFGVKWLGNA